jgi:arylsulfatase A-like enzyme
VGAYGYDRARTPAIDRLAVEGVLFERAIAQSSWTRPSFGTLFTSRYPSDHQAAWRLLKNEPGDRHSLYNRPLRSDLPTLAEMLDAGGYLTVAINTNVQTSKPFGFDHGFDHFIDVSRPLSVLTSSVDCRLPRLGLSKHCSRFSSVSADYPYLIGERVLAIFTSLADRLERSPRPFLLWLHFMIRTSPTVHTTATARARYDDTSDARRRRWGRSHAEQVGEMYDAAVAYVDGCVGRVLIAWTAPRPVDGGAVTSDHGEEIRALARHPRPGGLEYYYRGYGHGHRCTTSCPRR